MPKLSVYVPDELWEKVKAFPHSAARRNNSQLVQRALEQLVSEQEASRAAFATGAIRDTARLAAIVEQLRDEAKQEYERGYTAGLELAEALGFDDLRITMNGGGLHHDEGGISYVETFAGEETKPGLWWDRYSAAFTTGNEEWADWTFPSEPFRAGAAEALDDVWQALRANAWGTAPVAGAADAEADTSTADSEEKSG